MTIYCPGCGAEAARDQQYCRKCGVNLFLIGKALTLGETIARGDRGPLPKVKSMMDSLKVDQVSEEIGESLEEMNREIVKSMDSAHIKVQTSWGAPKRSTTNPLGPTPEQAHAQLVHQGAGSLFTGVAMMIAFYALSTTIILKIPPDVAAKIPFELEPVIRMAWVLGLMPALAGFGQLLAATFTRPRRSRLPEAEPPPQPLPEYQAPYDVPGSVTEHTTEFLDDARQTPRRETQ